METSTLLFFSLTLNMQSADNIANMMDNESNRKKEYFVITHNNSLHASAQGTKACQTY